MKRFARVVLVNLALILAGIAAAELAFGSWFSGDDFRLLNIPRNERRVFDVSSFIPSEPIVEYTRDAFGLRGDYGGDPADVDVVVLGGSTTNERFLSDDKTWVMRLQRRFREAGNSMRFANASVDGQSSLGHIAAVELWLSKIENFAPRHALLYVGINDAAVNPAEAHDSDLMRSPEGSRRIRHYIMNHSAIYDLFRTVRGNLQAREANLMHGGRFRETAEWTTARHEDPTRIRREYDARLAAYGERLDVLVTRLKAMSWEPVLITQPRGDHRRVGGVLEVLAPRRDGGPAPSDKALLVQDLFNDVTRATCARLALICVDVARGVTFADGDFYDPIHTTPSGSQRIADFLFRALKDVLKPRV